MGTWQSIFASQGPGPGHQDHELLSADVDVDAKGPHSVVLWVRRLDKFFAARVYFRASEFF